MAAKVLPNYTSASVLISLGGFANGFDTGSIGAVLSMPQFRHSFGSLSPFLVGFTVSLVMLAGVVPSIVTGRLADRFGRLRAILLGAAFLSVGALLQGAAWRFPVFVTGRALAGSGQGIYLGNMSVYICEIAPVRLRGKLAGLPQFLTTIGICAEYFTCYGSCLVALCIVLTCLVLPESPRWLVLHGRREEALRSLQQLQFPLTEAETDFMTTERRPRLSAWQSFSLLFAGGCRTPTILGLFVLGMIQLSGIDGVLYYAPTLFSQAGLSSETASFLASGVSAILMLAVSIPAFLLADKWGRRTSAITGGVGLSVCMLLIGCVYAAGAVRQDGVARWVVIVAVFVFGLTYCVTWGIVGKIYASEIQPAHTRAAASCVAQALAFFANWLVAILTPILLDKSSFGVYFLFGGLALATVLALSAYMPETRGCSLEDIQGMFPEPDFKNLTDRLRKLLRRVQLKQQLEQ
ncbi:general substrate transporter [Xylariaceae sp. FL0662B]|nr:general substrate transporter [Xylariaceae sp. FL0662B]